MIFVLIGAVAVIVAALLLRRKRHGWTADTDGNSYGTVVDASGSFTFPLLPNSIHYVTKGCGSLSGNTGIRLRYTIAADAGVAFVPISDPHAPSIGPTLYLQRAGDDWQSETYRWWATFAAPSPIVPGEFEIVASFAQRWTAVETSNSIDNPEAFRAALNNAARIGFTFGGGTGFGHGVYATGKASFTLRSLELI